MKPIIRVVCGIIWKDNTIFIARRKKGKHLAGYWEFPGGKLQYGEDPILGLERELLEELGMKVGEPEYFSKHFYEYENFIVDLSAYKCTFLRASFNLTDHDKYTFVEKFNLDDFNFTPADKYFIKLIHKN